MTNTHCLVMLTADKKYSVKDITEEHSDMLPKQQTTMFATCYNMTKADADKFTEDLERNGEYHKEEWT